MNAIGHVDQVQYRVFVVELPGMTRQREQSLIRSCQSLARSAAAAGIPLVEAWRPLGQLIERMIERLRTEHERETFAAVMQRLRLEFIQDFSSGASPEG